MPEEPVRAVEAEVIGPRIEELHRQLVAGADGVAVGRTRHAQRACLQADAERATVGQIEMEVAVVGAETDIQTGSRADATA